MTSTPATLQLVVNFPVSAIDIWKPRDMTYTESPADAADLAVSIIEFSTPFSTRGIEAIAAAAFYFLRELSILVAKKHGYGLVILVGFVDADSGVRLTLV